MEQKIVEITLSTAKLFNLYLNGHGISYTWVAQNLDLTPTYIYKICNEKVSLTKEIHEKLNELLDLSY